MLIESDVESDVEGDVESDVENRVLFRNLQIYSHTHLIHSLEINCVFKLEKL